ncbi:MAG: hypothetical protein JNM41_16295 [Flavipsychrobacter sp.]|nr:hypothetical protein [Flavipsychrobacter sp.]
MKGNNITKLFLVALIAISARTPAQNCRCKQGDRIYGSADKFLVCGSRNRLADSVGMVSAISILDCRRHLIVLDNHDDEQTMFQIRSSSSGVTITEQQLMFDSSGVGLTFVPLKSRRLIDNGYKIVLSRPSFAFKIPPLTNAQMRYLDSLHVVLSDGKYKKKPYPGDELSIYALFLGALANYNNCREEFEHLDKNYILDGALAETKAEIPAEYIFANLRNTYGKQ